MRGILIFIIVFGILVFVHEFGHFIIAKKSGILVREFSIGMGPKLFQKMYHQTTYTIRWLPLGGYVRLAGPDDAAVIDPGTTVSLLLNDEQKVIRIDASESETPLDGIPVLVQQADLVRDLTITGFENGDESQAVTYQVDHDATIIDATQTELLIAPLDTQFQEANIWKKIAVNIAGPLMNILLGFVVFLVWSVVSAGVPTTSVAKVVADSPAQAVGLKQGDEILQVNNQKITSWNEIQTAFVKNGTKPAKIEIKRNGQIKELTVQPETKTVDGQKLIQIGIYPQTSDNLGLKLQRGLSVGLQTTTMIFDALKGLVQNFSLNKLSGPVGIYSQTAQVSKMGFVYVLSFLASISINLGIVNLLPIPGLDGGKLLLNLFELLRGKPIPAEKEGMINLVGFALLLVLIIAVTGNDIYRYFIK